MGKTVLVTGATGTIGRDLVKIFSENGVPVRVGIRDQAKARKQFGADIELATFDFEDAASFPDALKDVERFSCCRRPYQIRWQWPMRLLMQRNAPACATL